LESLKIIPVLATVAVTGLAVLFAESQREMHTFRVNRYSVRVPGLSGRRILFVTDYHEAVNGKLNPGLLEASRKIRPDLILIGGDLVNGKTPNENVMPAVELVNGLADIAPVIYGYGNHERRMMIMSEEEEKGYDWDGYRAKLDPRVKFLRNEETVVSLRGKEAKVYGLDVGYEFYRRNGSTLPVSEMNRLLGERDESVPAILLAHDPSWFEAYTGWKADLTLSGHYHGGIIRLPGIGGIVNPKYQPFPKYDYGIYEKDGRVMLVGSGLGQHTIPVRWFNTPELVVVDLVD
jgi:hypothetical protein